MPSYKTLGLMSGTSLDGIDVAYCVFYYIDNQWSFHIPYAETYPYDDMWKNRLKQLPIQSAFSFVETDKDFGHFLGKTVLDFCKSYKVNPFLISSHGHTIFHTPSQKITSQIGNGAALAAVSKKIVISDFRTLDVALSGQGAPLVPAGDHVLFSDYDFCLNLGGFSNISFEHNKRRIAFDICPFNIILNKLYKKAQPNASKDFDDRGVYTSAGRIDNDLLTALNALSFYDTPPPKSLAREWLEQVFEPVIDGFPFLSYQEKLRTVAEHIALQISFCLSQYKNGGKVFITGGGAYNSFIINLISEKNKNFKVVLPEKKIIDFKEALIFAFLGLLRYLEKPNCMKDVTGALRDSSCGCIYDGREK